MCLRAIYHAPQMQLVSTTMAARGKDLIAIQASQVDSCLVIWYRNDWFQPVVLLAVINNIPEIKS